MSTRQTLCVVAAAAAVLLTGSVAMAQGRFVAPGLDLSRSDRSVAGLHVESHGVSPPWVEVHDLKLPRYPFMADPRRWPRIFANTTEGTLSLDPITRRHWWQG